MAIIELVCKAEDKVVARIETPGRTNALAITRGITIMDRARSPDSRTVTDGVQMFCRHCTEPLYFRGADGEMFAAMPSSVNVLS